MLPVLSELPQIELPGVHQNLPPLRLGLGPLVDVQKKIFAPDSGFRVCEAFRAEGAPAVRAVAARVFPPAEGRAEPTSPGIKPKLYIADDPTFLPLPLLTVACARVQAITSPMSAEEKAESITEQVSQIMIQLGFDRKLSLHIKEETKIVIQSLFENADADEIDPYHEIMTLIPAMITHLIAAYQG
jgi:hypothetical protein